MTVSLPHVDATLILPARVEHFLDGPLKTLDDDHHRADDGQPDQHPAPLTTQLEHLF